MDPAAFIEALHTACADALDSYRTAFPDGPPVTKNSLDIPRTTVATEAAVHARFSELVSVYDALFDVDSTPYRDDWREHLVYDCSRRERLRLLTHDLPASISLVMIEGYYASSTGHIGVSDGQLAPPTAYSFLASELCHAYQDRFASPTWTHPYTMEGFEQAASYRALEQLAETLDDAAVTQRVARERARILLQGVVAHGTRRGGISPGTVRELGVTDAELTSLLAHPLRRPLRVFRPRSQWSSTAFLPEYDLFGSLLLVSEREGVADTYARAFRGEHPWDALVADIRSIPPNWLWRRYRS